ncbi:hypothetical protein ACHAWF_016617 [Thalassiosira exigua]
MTAAAVEVDLILSRPSYQAGTPVVGTVRIHRAETDNVEDVAVHHEQQPIRSEIVSARLYLAGRAHLGSNARGQVSQWRSAHDINQLKRIYGEEHACLLMAKMAEQACWRNEWNGDNRHRAESVLAGDNAPSNGEVPKATFYETIERPPVTHIEQAERLAVHSYLHPSSSSIKAKADGNAQEQSINDYSGLPTPQDNNVICFWMTNALELLDVPERHLDRKCTCTPKKNCCECQQHLLRPGRGKYLGDMNPHRPLQLPDLKVVQGLWKDMKRNVAEENAENTLSQTDSDGNTKKSPRYQTQGGEEELERDVEKQTPASPWERVVASANASEDVSSNCKEKEGIALEDKQLALSFRADLPPGIVPTMTAKCVKYFYSAVLVVTTARGELLVEHCPFGVLTSNMRRTSLQQSHQTSTARVHIGDLRAFAHSAGLPTYITSTEASDATTSQLTVVANPPACDIVSRRTAERRTSTHRIVDGKGCFCGMMTLVGLGGPLVPGTRLGVRVRFPIYDDDGDSNGAGIIPCHRVCCALVGEEYAIFEGISASSTGGGDVLQKGKKKVKTRSYVFDSAYEMVEYGYTEAISMGLVLPLDCPVTVSSELVELSVRLKVEFTVSQRMEGSIEGAEQRDFGVIRLDLPCEVVHVDEELNEYAEDEGEEGHGQTIRAMQQFWNSDTETDSGGFDDTGIHKDLKMLSMRMLKEVESLTQMSI